MKKFFLSLLFLLFLTTNAFAAWTIDVTLDSTTRGDKLRVKIVAVSDGSDPAEFELDTSTLNTYLNEYAMRQLKGAIFWEVETDPGTAPDAVWAVSFDSGAGASLLDLSGLSVSATERNDASTDLGYNPIIWDNVQVDIGDIGSASDSVTIYLIFLK